MALYAHTPLKYPQQILGLYGIFAQFGEHICICFCVSCPSEENTVLCLYVYLLLYLLLCVKNCYLQYMHVLIYTDVVHSIGLYTWC